jgi:hypothetical protein
MCDFLRFFGTLGLRASFNYRALTYYYLTSETTYLYKFLSKSNEI